MQQNKREHIRTHGVGAAAESGGGTRRGKEARDEEIERETTEPTQNAG